MRAIGVDLGARNVIREVRGQKPHEPGNLFGLRHAILAANASGKPSRIRFHFSSCPQLLPIASPLPPIQVPLLVDGYWDPASHPNTQAPLADGAIPFDAELCAILVGSGSPLPETAFSIAPGAGPGVHVAGVVRDELVGGRAIAAIRPEDLMVGTVGENQLNVTVEVVEYHGREQSVQGRLGDSEAVFFRTDKRLAPGDQVTLSVPTERVLLFSTVAAAAPAELVT